jgi:hypothetical protein
MKNVNWLKTILVFLSLTSFILTFLLYNTNKTYNKLELTYKNQTDSLEVLNDSLRNIIYEKLEFKNHFNGVTEMTLENYIDEKFLTEDAKKDIDFVSKYTHEQRVEIVNELNKLNLTHEDWYTTLEVYRVTKPKVIEEIEKISGHYSE